jgi:hypothetical protein
LTLKQRVKDAAKPHLAQYGRAPVLVKGATWVLVALIIIPDPFDWIPGLALMDELLYASVLLWLLHKYGAAAGEDKRSAKDLVNEIIGRKTDGH